MNCTKDACQKEDANARVMLLEILLSAESATLFLFFFMKMHRALH